MAEVVQLLLGAGGLGVLGMVIMVLLTHLRSDRKPAADAIRDAQTRATEAEERAAAARRREWAAEDALRGIEAENERLRARLAMIEQSTPPPDPTGGPV